MLTDMETAGRIPPFEEGFTQSIRLYETFVIPVS